MLAMRALFHVLFFEPHGALNKIIKHSTVKALFYEIKIRFRCLHKILNNRALSLFIIGLIKRIFHKRPCNLLMTF